MRGGVRGKLPRSGYLHPQRGEGKLPRGTFTGEQAVQVGVGRGQETPEYFHPGGQAASLEGQAIKGAR